MFGMHYLPEKQALRRNQGIFPAQGLFLHIFVKGSPWQRILLYDHLKYAANSAFAVAIGPIR